MIPSFDSSREPSGISVIVCCYNSEKRLPEALKCLARQAVPASIPWEVIVVVDKASTDDTADVAFRVWQETGAPAPLCLLEESKPGKSSALETGFTAAKYEVLVTVDDDNWLDAAYLHTAYEIMAKIPENGVLGGEITGVFEVEPPKWFVQLQSFYAVGPQGRKSGDITSYKTYVAGAAWW